MTRVSTTSPKAPKALRTAASRSPATDRDLAPAPPQSSVRFLGGARRPETWSVQLPVSIAPSSFLPWCRSQALRSSDRFRPKTSYVAFSTSPSSSSSRRGISWRCVQAGPSGQRPRAKSRQKSRAPSVEPSVAPQSRCGTHRVMERFRWLGVMSPNRARPPASSWPYWDRNSLSFWLSRPMDARSVRASGSSMAHSICTRASFRGGSRTAAPP
mmetsp:Transcript_27467/g.93486  ORF Transcript_27467/g.93486 Transcript_27467/m.93486 type:complete len:213 (-) Transcript_27467:123-761(-)